MSGVIGKGNRSYIKAQVGESLLGDFNVTSLQWVHEITAAEVAGRATGTTFRIDFTSLNFPTTNEIRVAGFTNPTTNRITALGIGNHRTNLTVKTSLKRELIDFLSYQADDTGITLTSDVSIVAGESFIFTFDQNVQNGNRVVNARPLRKTAIIPAQRRRIAIGSTIEVAPSIINADGIDSQQIGNIQVFAEGKILFRNAGNVAGDILTSGNYREVFLDNVTDAGIEAANVVNNGTANAIELNVALAQEADVMIISTNLIVDSTTNTISLLTNEAATKLNELPTLDAANASQFLQVNAAGNAYQLTGSTAHVIEDGDGTDATPRNNLQFLGTTVTDDAANNRTIVNTQTLFQTKSITANFATGTADVTALQFNNLEIGKQYRLSGAMGFGSGSTGAFDAFVLFRSATGGTGTIYGRSGTFNQGGQSTGGSFGVNIVFTATSSTIVPRTSFDNAGRIVADTSAPTFLTLEELPAHTVTTQWT